MTHPLDGSTERIDRATEHLLDFKNRIRTFERLHKDRFLPKYDPQTKRFVIVGTSAGKPEKTSVIIGEIVYNLRCALDYLIYELSCLDSGAYQEGTQFPIEDTPNGFKGRCKTYLKGVSDVHVAEIKKLQPAYGCTWTGILRDLSNKDKHRAFTIVLSSGETVIRSIRRGSPVAATDLLAPGTDDVYVDLDSSIRVTFEDGTPVIETLEKLKTEVGNVVVSFKGDFP